MSAANDNRGHPKCPICERESVADYRPFCSSRCKIVDLNRWLGGVYRVPSHSAPEDGLEGGATPSQEKSGEEGD